MVRIRWRKRRGAPATIPTASMADIAFLLLIFFLTSTIIRLENGLEIDLPQAESAVRVSKPAVTHIWVDREGQIAIDDVLVQASDVGGILRERLRASGQITVSIQADRVVPYRVIDRVIGELKRADVRNVSFGTLSERGAP